MAQQATGNAGNVMVEADNLTLVNGATIGSGTFGRGNGGNVDITANDITFESINLRGEPSSVDSRVEAGAEGNAGDVTINTGNFSLINGGQINASTLGQGDGGNIDITATQDINIASGQFNSSIFSVVDFVAVGKAGNVNISSGNLTLSNGGQINASTFGQGDGGNINLDATTVSVLGGASLNSNVGVIAKGEAGNITINANDVVFDGGFARSRLEPGGEGSGGDIRIATGSLLVTGISPELTGNTGQLVTATFGQGDAGSLEIDATGDVIFDGSGSDVFSLIGGNLEIPDIDPAEGNAGNITINSGSLSIKNQARLVSSVEGIGNAGSININTNSLSITNEGKILSEVSNTGIGDAGGNIEIVAESVDVKDGGQLSASTALTGNGGNIILEIADLLLLRNNASISTTAGVEGAGGDGGSIEINADVILAFPLENSDIIANAFEGNGGNIDIEAQAIFGIENRQATEDNITNDIDASSELGLSGTVKINILQTDPSQGSLNIPVETVQAEVTQVCEANSSSGARSEFVVTGRGGLPTKPEDNFRLRAVAPNRVAESISTPKNGSKSEASQPIVEANKWIRNDQGKIVLLASSATGSSLDSHSNSTNCNL